MCLKIVGEKDAGCTALAEVLLVNTVLQSLAIKSGTDQFSRASLTALAQALRKNQTLKRLTLQIYGEYDDSEEEKTDHQIDLALRDGLLEVGLALQEVPRPHTFELLGCHNDKPEICFLSTVAIGLGLPAEAQFFDNHTICYRFHGKPEHRDISLEFAMGQHRRLGAHSCIRVLGCEVVDFLLRMHFGMGVCVCSVGRRDHREFLLGFAMEQRKRLLKA